MYIVLYRHKFCYLRVRNERNGVQQKNKTMINWTREINMSTWVVNGDKETHWMSDVTTFRL